MYLLLLLWLAICADALSHWEPCKLQCEKNFKRNEITQPLIINVCKRGCDLFTVALISTSHPSSSIPADQLQRSNDLPQIVTSLNEQNKILVPALPIKQENVLSSEQLFRGLIEKSHDMPKEETKASEHLIPKQDKSTTTDKSKSENTILKSPSILENQVNSLHLKNKHKLFVPSRLSKTTEEPISQPVQDHPVEAGKQTTTPKGPKRDNSKLVASPKELGEVSTHKNALKNMLHPNSIQFTPNTHHKEEDLTDSKKNEEPLRDETMEQRIEQAKHSCRHACVTAYGGAKEQEACVVGCHLQATTASLKPLEKEKSLPKSPIAVFQHVAFSLAHHVGRLVRVTWALASSSSDNGQDESPLGNKVQVYGSEVMTRQAQVPLFIGLRQSYNAAEVPKRPEEEPIETNSGMNLMNGGIFRLPRPLDRSNSVNTHLNMPDIITIIKEESKDMNSELPRQEEKEKQFQEQLKKMENVLDVISESDKRSKDSQHGDHQGTQPQLDLLECISRKSGLPRWFIAIAIFASALVVLWLCFSLTAPPDDIKVVKRKPDINECLLEDDDDDYDDDSMSCSEKKKLLARADDVIKIRIENV